MGTVYQAVCPNCQYQETLHLGSGLAAVNLHRNLRVLSQEEQDCILTMEQGHQIKAFHIENKLIECTHCHTLQAKAIIDITDQNDHTRVFGNHCSICGESGQLTDLCSAHITCPKCGKAQMSFTETGLWD